MNDFEPAPPPKKVGRWSEGLLQQTVDVWQPYADYSLSREDAREILENLTGFFKVLEEWDRRERARSGGQNRPDDRH